MSYSESELEQMWNSMDLSWKKGAVDHVTMSCGIIVGDKSYSEILNELESWGERGEKEFKNYIIWVSKGSPHDDPNTSSDLYVKEGNDYVNRYY